VALRQAVDGPVTGLPISLTAGQNLFLILAARPALSNPTSANSNEHHQTEKPTTRPTASTVSMSAGAAGNSAASYFLKFSDLGVRLRLALAQIVPRWVRNRRTRLAVRDRSPPRP